MKQLMNRTVGSGLIRSRKYTPSPSPSPKPFLNDDNTEMYKLDQLLKIFVINE